MKSIITFLIILSFTPLHASNAEAPRVRAIVFEQAVRVQRRLTNTEIKNYRENCIKKYILSASRNTCFSTMPYTTTTYMENMLSTANNKDRNKISEIALSHEPFNNALLSTRQLALNSEVKNLIAEYKTILGITNDIFINVTYRVTDDSLRIFVYANDANIVVLFDGRANRLSNNSDLIEILAKKLNEIREEHERTNRTNDVLEDYSNITEEDDGQRFI